MGSVHGQNEDDALRMSTVTPGGTARSIGVANAFGALGADGVSIAINPAGLGIYRTSEVSMTPGLEVNSVASSYYGSVSTNSATRAFFNNLALVINAPSNSGSKWRSSTFGVIYDRQATNRWDRQAVGYGIPSSMLDALALDAEGNLPDELYDNRPFTSALAYETYGIDPADPVDSMGTSYISALPAGALVDQQQTVESKGATSNTSFFYSANYMDKLYVGLSVGIIGHRYSSTTTHTEDTPDGSVDLKSMTFREELGTSGNGLDVKAGAIYRLTDKLRTGLAFHSPRWMQLNDTYITDMRTSFRSAGIDGRTDYSAESPDGLFSYRINTPWRTVLSAGYVTNAGLISIDYEYVDYRNMRLRPMNNVQDPYDFANENAVIRETFRQVHSVRVGTEWRSGNWYYRMGWGILPNAFDKDEARHAAALKTYAAGLGYRTDRLSLDLGVNYQTNGYNYYQYDPMLVDVTRETRSTVRTLVTVAWRP
ncbi:MAG: hypothetical protein R2818_06675 [Flavobacteriales bacterium]